MPHGCINSNNFCNSCHTTNYDPLKGEFRNVIHDTVNGKCIICSEMAQFEWRDNRCYNICGNGYLYSLGSHDPSSCDDGNTIDGDGCSSECLVEQDYICKRGGLSADASELADKVNQDVCNQVLTIIFRQNTDNAIGNPRLDLQFNEDVCITERFLQIYEPYCVKKDETTGQRVKIIDFIPFEVEPCRVYFIEYVLMNNYSGEISFQRKDAELPNEKKAPSGVQVRQEIRDARNNIVDFTE
jgi:cysteine-rich repeat protein